MYEIMIIIIIIIQEMIIPNNAFNKFSVIVVVENILRRFSEIRLPRLKGKFKKNVSNPLPGDSHLLADHPFSSSLKPTRQLFNIVASGS